MAKIESFRFWCQKVLPLVYDESLSYYELLCKMTTYLNNTIQAVNENTADVAQMRQELNQFEEFINNYFDNLDVQQEINNKLDAMAASGELTNLMKPYIDEMTEGFDERLQTAQHDAAVANERISQILNLTPGSTTLDAEVEDIRVGQNNVTYPSAGDAVRGQIGDINMSFKAGFNIFDKRNVIEGGYYFHGVFQENAGYWCTPLIYIGYTDKTFVRTNFQPYAADRFDSLKQPIARSGETIEWYDRYGVPAMLSTYTNAYYIAFAFPDTVDPDDVMITLTDETAGGTEDRWSNLFPGLGYVPYNWEVDSKKVNIQSVSETLDDFAAEMKNETGINNDDFFKIFEKTSGAAITTDAYTGSKIVSFTGQSANKTWCRASMKCRPSKCYVLEFMGYATHTDYSADSSTGAMLVVEFFDGSGAIIGQKYNAYVLGSTNRGYHRYGFVSPYGADTVKVRVTTRKNTDIALSDLSFKEVECFPMKPEQGILYDGHLGYIYSAPRNTIPSFELGKVAGFRTMITNVNVTSDGVLVALHNDTIDATSDGTGNVRDYTFEQLQEFDFGSWFNAAYTGTRIPTFEEVISYIGNNGQVPAVSLHGNLSNAELTTMCNIFKKHGLQKCVIKSFSLPTLQYVGNILGASAEYIYDSNSADPATVDLLAALPGKAWIEAEVAEVNTTQISYAHNHGVGYSAYFGNDLARVKELIKLGVDRFCVDTFSDIVIPLD